MDDRHAAARIAALGPARPAATRPLSDGLAIAALIAGATLVGRRFDPDRPALPMPRMMALNLLHELHLLLGHALAEAAAAARPPMWRDSASTERKLTILGGAYGIDGADRRSLARICAERRRLAAHKRPASARRPADALACPAVTRLLADAAAVHATVAEKLRTPHPETRRAA